MVMVTIKLALHRAVGGILILIIYINIELANNTDYFKS